MQKTEVDYSRVPYISSKDLNYIDQASFLEDFYAYKPEIESFQSAINDRKITTVDRALLVKVLQEQYSDFHSEEAVIKNIELLRSETTFTVITAHQPSLFTGPLYYIYKVASTINLCQTLKDKYPSFDFVPVFVSGGEDHDLEEVNHVRLFNKQVVWSTDQIGSVGRMDTHGIRTALDEMTSILGGSTHAEEIANILTSAIDNSETYGGINRQILHKLMGRYGLVTLSMDQVEMKRAFIPVLKKEILERKSEALVQDTQSRLADHGFKAQAFPRDINLFYLNEQGRNRITYQDETYQVVDTEITFTEEEILKELESHPDRFSPNVVLRPVYQEFSLPNLAYVGGGGELAYWLERKSQFQEYGVFFPMLVRRNSVKLLDRSAQKKITKLGIELEDILKENHEIIHDFLQKNTSINIDLSEERKIMDDLWNRIAKKAESVDPTLAKAALSELSNQQKSIDSMESRIRRKLKSDEEVNIKRIESLKQQLFPDHSLQERKENIWQYYNQVGPSLIDYLVDNLDPLTRKFSIITIP